MMENTFNHSRPPVFSRKRWPIAAIAFIGIFSVLAYTHEQGKSSDVASRHADMQKNPDIAVARGRIDIDGGVVQLTTSREGVIQEVRVEEGAHVEKGQILATFDARQATLNLQLVQKERDQLQNHLEMQRLQVAIARREQSRLSRLSSEDAASGIEVDQAKDKTRLLHKEIAHLKVMLEAQQVRVKLAQLDIDKTVIHAPADGVVIRRQAQQGQGIGTLNVTPLFWFAPDVPRIIRAELEDQFIRMVKPGMLADVFFEGNPIPAKAKVLRLGQFLGHKRNTVEEAVERNDVQVLECLLTPLDSGVDWILGQRVLVRIKG